MLRKQIFLLFSPFSSLLHYIGTLEEKSEPISDSFRVYDEHVHFLCTAFHFKHLPDGSLHTLFFMNRATEARRRWNENKTCVCVCVYLPPYKYLCVCPLQRKPVKKIREQNFYGIQRSHTFDHVDVVCWWSSWWENVHICFFPSLFSQTRIQPENTRERETSIITAAFAHRHHHIISCMAH